jgi:FtsH-binding integral membrane protein
MADLSGKSARLVAFLWLLTTAFVLFSVILRYSRTGKITWNLIAAAAFTLVMGLARLKRSRSAGG